MTQAANIAPDLAPPPTLEVRGGRKNFGAVHALRGVDLVARAGEVTALVGDNGAGKSTMIKCIAGIFPFDAGDVLFEGQEAHISSPADSSELGIEVVYQDLALCDNLDIVHNMFLGRELKKGFRLDESAMETRAAEVLASLSVRTVRSIRQHVASLSGGQRQTVAIARAVLWNSKLVILDEPTAALGVAQTEQVLQLVRRLADAGLAVVLVSHNMNEVLEVADSVNVLYLGQTAAQVRAKDTTRSEIIELITSGSAALPPTPVAAASAPTDAPNGSTPA
ncbi:ATP-binding cassette domain-containing protein [Cellulomonas sp. McL0617]|uniref:ATP-binding cassette domain-containing protein n=1 Tax=Cellulomonas sp. McL0617 TaxID=3415675 RepID=UPI003CE7FA4D